MNAGIIAAIVAAVAAIAGGLIQSSSNKKLAEYQADRNEDYLQKQLDYNTPQMQMQRFQEAGLNPALIYGQGNPGNQSQPLQFPEMKSAEWQSIVPTGVQNALQDQLLISQRQNLDAKTLESSARKSLVEIQTQVAEKNPLLNKAVYGAMVESFISAAQLKASEAGLASQKLDWSKTKTVQSVTGSGLNKHMELVSNGWQKMDAELRLLDQKFDLGSKDQQIKAEILESKEFQNEILEVQKRFMADGDLTPQHMVTFIQLLLMRLAR